MCDFISELIDELIIGGCAVELILAIIATTRLRVEFRDTFLFNETEGLAGFAIPLVVIGARGPSVQAEMFVLAVDLVATTFWTEYLNDKKK